MSSLCALCLIVLLLFDGGLYYYRSTSIGFCRCGLFILYSIVESEYRCLSILTITTISNPTSASPPSPQYHHQYQHNYFALRPRPDSIGVSFTAPVFVRSVLTLFLYPLNIVLPQPLHFWSSFVSPLHFTMAHRPDHCDLVAAVYSKAPYIMLLRLLSLLPSNSYI